MKPHPPSPSLLLSPEGLTVYKAYLMNGCINLQILRVAQKHLESLVRKMLSGHFLRLLLRTWHMQSSEVLACDSVQFIIRTSVLRWFRLHISLYRHLLRNLQLGYMHVINIIVFAGINYHALS